MKKKILKTIKWLYTYSTIDVDSLADDIVAQFEVLAERYPNDTKLGNEIRKLLNEEK